MSVVSMCVVSVKIRYCLKSNAKYRLHPKPVYYGIFFPFFDDLVVITKCTYKQNLQYMQWLIILIIIIIFYITLSGEHHFCNKRQYPNDSDMFGISLWQ